MAWFNWAKKAIPRKPMALKYPFKSIDESIKSILEQIFNFNF